MPTYEFRNVNSNEIEEHVLKMSELDGFKKDNPHLERYIDTPPAFGFDAFTGDLRSKTPDSFKEVLHKIAEKHPNSALANDITRKSIKQVQTEQVLLKYKKKREQMKKDGVA